MSVIDEIRAALDKRRPWDKGAGIRIRTEWLAALVEYYEAAEAFRVGPMPTNPEQYLAEHKKRWIVLDAARKRMEEL